MVARLFVLAAVLMSTSARAEQLCPAARDLPQLTIDKIDDPAIPVIDKWQIFLGDVPISDAQLATMAANDPLIDMTRAEMRLRGTYVYLSTATLAFGTAVSSVGFMLYGQDNLSQSITLTMAVGGLTTAIAGLLMITQSIQTPLEPHLAPTPRHRLSRNEVRQLIAQINRKLYRDICKATVANTP